jgi:EmrB/QacA subfamily drug resistance transporter
MTSSRWALTALCLSMLLSSLGTSIANVALPTLTASFSAPFQAVQWLVLAYLLALTASIVGAGRLGDLLGRRRSLCAGLIIFTLGSALSGAAPVLWLVIVARAVQGLGAALMMALTLAFVGELVPREKTGSVMGLLGTMSAIGTALGPSLGGALIALLGWRAIFLFNVPLGALAALLAHHHLPADRAATRRITFDHAGTLVLAATLVSYALALTLRRGPLTTHNVVLLLTALAGVALFVAIERRAASPVVRLALFLEATLSASLAANALVSTVLMATLVVGPFYLSRSLGLDAGRTGLVLSLGPLVAALVGVPAGRIVDRFGTQRTSLFGVASAALGCAALSVTPSALGVAGYGVPTVIVTAGYALFQAANNTAVMRDVTPDQRGIVSATLNLSRNLGLISGTALMGAVFALATGTNDLAAAAPAAVASGTHVTFAVATAMLLLALLVLIGGHVRSGRGQSYVAARP